MRHTHLSLLAYKGYSIAEIQRRARHSDPRTTAKYYVHILDEREWRWQIFSKLKSKRIK